MASSCAGEGAGGGREGGTGRLPGGDDAGLMSEGMSFAEGQGDKEDRVF